MYCRGRHPLLFIPVTLVVGYAIYCHFDDHLAKSDTHLIDGTWTEQRGVPGNSIHIYSVRAPTPPNYWGLECYEGRIDLKHHFGEKEIRTSWNYGSLDPLILNVLIPIKGIRFAAIKILDPDHLLIRFGNDIDPRDGDRIFRHPDVKRLTRRR
jgi:hypothetical protein